MAETAAPSVAPDERLVRVGPLTRVLTRPDIGALLGAVAVFFAFAYFARAVNWIGDPAIAAGWTDQAAQYGIIAVPVALLMIGGEFDLSAGVMIGSSGLLLGYLTTHADMNIWPAIAIVLLFGLVIGFVNGITVIKTKLPSFIVTLATFFVLQGVNAAGTLKLTGQTAIQDIDTASGFESARKLFAGDLTHYDFKVKVLWWIAITIIGAWLLTGGFGSVIGTFFGAAMLGMVQLGIVDSQWDSNWTFTFQGGILFAAVMLNTLIRSRAQKAR